MDKVEKIISIVFDDKSCGHEGNRRRRMKIIASTEDVDRDLDIIRAKGWQIENYMKNPVILVSHNWRGEPVAKANKVYVEDDKLIIEDIEFAETEEGEKYKYLVENEYIKTVSVGFIPKKVFFIGDEDQVNEMKDLDNEWYEKNKDKLIKARRVVWEAELLEVSLVPIPANPNAMIVMAQKGLDYAVIKNDEGQLIEIDITPYREYKGVVPYSIHPKGMKVRKSSTWDKNKAIKSLLKWASSDGSGEWEKVNKRKFRAGFGYVDDANADKLSAYKYPHHYAEGNDFYVDERGVEVAMAFTLARRGNLTEEEFKGLYNHLAKHYTNDLNREPPKWKDKAYTIEELMKTFNDEVIAEIVKENPEDFIKYLRIKLKELEIVKNELKDKSEPPSPDNKGLVEDNGSDKEDKIVLSDEDLSKAISLAVEQFLKNFKGGK